MVNRAQMCKGPDGSLWPWETYPPLSVGVRPKRVQSPTDMSSELSTVTTAARARPHLDLTMSILPKEQRGHIRAVPPPAPGTLLNWAPKTECAISQGRERSCLTGRKGRGRKHFQSQGHSTPLGSSSP
uniref:Uncharacterized protein n=1 Tax=Mus spicilegus TaxID=10103 RepID=A0A8C6N1X1_MUSSI